MVKDMKTAVKSTVHTLLHFQLGRNKFEPLTSLYQSGGVYCHPVVMLII